MRKRVLAMLLLLAFLFTMVAAAVVEYAPLWS